MAIDTQNLVYLIDPFWQAENNNGKPIVNGHMEVFIAGTDTKYITWQNWDGTKNPFKIPLGSDGRATILVEPEYTYDCYLYDSFNNLAVSRLNVKPNLGGDVYGLSQVYHDDTLTGNGTVTSPLGMVSAKLGVQEPIYFVEDDSATVIGLRESAYSGLPYVENSAIGYGMAGMQPYVSSISGLGFYALSAGSAASADLAGSASLAGSAASADLANSASLAGSATLADSASISYSAENAGLVTDGWETGSDGRITAYNGTAFSAGKVYSGVSPVWVNNDTDQIGVSSKDFLANSPLYFTEYSDRVELSISGLPPTPGLMYESGFNYESGKITGYNGSGISAGKVYSGISPITVDNVNDTISVASATLGVQAPLYFVEDSESATVIGLNTAQIQIDIPESANWENAYSTVNNNSASWTSAADELAVLNTAKWDSTCDYVSSHSADWNNKLDSSIYAEDSGNFYTKDNPSGFITGVDLTPYQLTADMTGYLTTADSSEFYPMTGNPSGFLTAETDWTDTIMAASAYAYSEATALIPTALTGDYIETSAIKSAQISDSAFITGFYDGQISATFANEANKAISARKADSAGSAYSAAYVYSGWGAKPIFHHTDAVIKQYYAVTGSTQGFPAGNLYKFNAYSADSAYEAGSAEKARNDILGRDITTTYQTIGGMTAYQPVGDYYSASNPSGFISELPQSANWNSTYTTVSSNSATWGGGSSDGIVVIDMTLGSYDPQEIYNTINSSWGLKSIYAKVNSTPTTYSPNRTLYLPVNIRYPYDDGASQSGYLYEGNYQFYVDGQYALNGQQFRVGYDSINDNYTISTPQINPDMPVPIAWPSDDGRVLTVRDDGGIEWRAPQGGDLPQSATEAIDVVTGGSANWNSTYNTVSNNSASWGGGSDVPEGVMVESGLEYNAVNEISGYNGSAIAQYGAEKQWLVHDDTLVHASNSAQYALGVNLSAVAQLLGVDETVLFETTALNVSSVSLSEPLSSFKRFRLYPYQSNAGYYNYGEFDYDTVHALSTGNNIRLLYSRSIGGNNPIQFLYGDYTLSNDTKGITAISGVRRWFPASTGAGGSDSNNTYIMKIVGIGRKA